MKTPTTPAEQTRQQLGLLIHEAMKAQGYTRTALAEQAGITRQQMQTVIEGTRAYTIDTLLSILGVLGIYTLHLPRSIKKP